MRISIPGWSKQDTQALVDAGRYGAGPEAKLLGPAYYGLVCKAEGGLLLDCWQNSRENVVLLNAPLIHSGFLPCVAWMNPSNTIAGVWTAPGLRRQGFASALLSLLEPELKFVQKRSRTLEFIQRTCPNLAVTCGQPEPVAEYEKSECAGLHTNLLTGTNTLPCNKENVEVLSALLNEKLGTGYYHFQCLPENGIECFRSPGWRVDHVSWKEVRLDILDDGRGGRLRFTWKNARWSDWERQMVIACFMKVFAFTDLDPAFYKKQEIETLLATL